VVADPRAPYYGIVLNDQSLVPAGADARLGAIRFEDWLSHR
jgi:hypothetical protein